jgi:hypothetical protein
VIRILLFSDKKRFRLIQNYVNPDPQHFKCAEEIMLRNSFIIQYGTAVYVDILKRCLDQCCGSGSGIGCLFDPGIRDGRKSASGSGIRDEQPGPYFLELRNHFFSFLGVKILKFFADPGWRQFGSGIRDGKKSDPGSGKIPDPPH